MKDMDNSTIERYSKSQEVDLPVWIKFTLEMNVHLSHSLD